MPQLQLIMKSGPTPGVVFPLEGQQFFIGRDASNEIRINDPEVSRRHARLGLQGARFVIEDLGSTNGTFVNGHRLSASSVLNPGDMINLGERIVLVYEFIRQEAGATVVTPRPAWSTESAIKPDTHLPAEEVASPQNQAVPPKNFNMLYLLAGGGLLFFICVCIAFFWWVDANFLWCTFLPFLKGCP